MKDLIFVFILLVFLHGSAQQRYIYVISEVEKETFKSSEITDEYGNKVTLRKDYVSVKSKSNIFNGKTFIVSETKYDCEGYPIEYTSFDYTPLGGRFVYEYIKYKNKVPADDGTGWLKPIPDGICEIRTLPKGLLNGEWQDYEDSWKYEFKKKKYYEKTGKVLQSRVSNATAKVCGKRIFIAGINIDFIDPSSDFLESYWCPPRYYDTSSVDGKLIPGISTRHEVNYYDLNEMIKIFIKDLSDSNHARNGCSSARFDDPFYSYNLSSATKLIGPKTPVINGITQYKVDDYNYTFLDLINHRIYEVDVTFTKLDKGVIGLSHGIYDDDRISIEIDAIEWENSSLLERWYTIYHEMGHDFLNLKHGEGGRLMFNFSMPQNYKWEDFFNDRDYMFNYYFDNFRHSNQYKEWSGGR